MKIRWIISKITTKKNWFYVFNVDLDVNKYQLPDGATMKDGKYIKCVLYNPEIDLEEGTSVIMQGNFEAIDKKYINPYNRLSLQLKILSIEVTSGIDTEYGLKIFLQLHISHIWPVRADALVKKHGIKLLEIFDKDLKEVAKTLTKEKWIWTKTIKKIKQSRDEKKKFREILIFLNGECELSIPLAYKVYHEFGEECVQKIKENPYLLTQIKRIWFKRADELALKLGIDPKGDERYASLVEFCLLQLIDYGDSLVAVESIKKWVADYLLNEKDFSHEEIDTILETWIAKALESGKIVKINEEIYMLKSFAIVEKVIARYFVSNRDKVSWYDNLVTGEQRKLLTKEQEKAVDNCMNKKVSLLLWPAGSGKTFTTKVITETLNLSKISFVIISPTNAAVKRVKEVNWDDIEVFTIDKLLGLVPWEDPKFNAENPVNYKHIIIDESSMADERKLYFLLQALPADTNLTLIWDPNQLPPVGVGSPFADLIESGDLEDNTVLLTKVKRQENNTTNQKGIQLEEGINNIVHNAGCILGWEMPKNTDTDNVIRFFDQLGHTEEIQNKIFSTLFENMRYLQKIGENLIKDWQILIPTYKGSVGIININNEISNYLLPDAQVFDIRWKEYKQWDKVVYHGQVFEWLVKWDIGIFKGYHSNEKKYIVDFFWVGEKLLSEDRVLDLSLGYAMSVHRSQGNERKYCTVIITFWAFQLLNKELLYTAYTRAKEKVFLLWERKAVSVSLKNSIGMKNTYLYHYLLQTPNEEIELLKPRINKMLTEKEKKFIVEYLNAVYDIEGRLIRTKQNKNTWFKYIFSTKEKFPELQLQDGIFIENEQLSELQQRNDLLILKIIRDEDWWEKTNEEYASMIKKGDKKLIDEFNPYNLLIIVTDQKKVLYNKGKSLISYN